MFVSLSSGRIVTSVQDAAVTPHRIIGRNPVVYHHGAANDAREVYGVTGLGAINTINTALTESGFAVNCITQPQKWGNAASQTNTAAAMTDNRSRWGSSSNPAILIGASHGVSCALKYAANNPTLVACVVGFIPAFSLQSLRVADTNGARAVIDAAYTVTYPTDLPAGADPIGLITELSAVPIQLWYSNDDAFSVDIVSFSAAVGADLHDVGAMGHTNAAIGEVSIPDVISFIEASL